VRSAMTAPDLPTPETFGLTPDRPRAPEHPSIRASEHPSIRASGHPGIRASGHPGIRASGHPGIRASGHPGIRASGHPGIVVMQRKVKNQRLAAVGYVWPFATLTASPPARAHYDRRRAAGDGHPAALR
jgi:hypothetical protein